MHVDDSDGICRTGGLLMRCGYTASCTIGVALAAAARCDSLTRPAAGWASHAPMNEQTRAAAPAGASHPAGRVLLIDDDRKLARLLSEYLQAHGMSVAAVHDGAEGIERARADAWDLIVLDVMLPGLGGFAVLKHLRALSPVPVLMLTARGGEEDRIHGLEQGADDYVAKTASLRELLARIRALLRRAGTAAAPAARAAEVVAGPLRIVPASRSAALDGRPLALTPVEFDLLLALSRHQGKVRSREQLLDQVRDREFDVYDRSIDVHIASLRRKLGDDPREPRFIRTVRTVGYMLIEPGVPQAAGGEPVPHRPA